MRNRMPIFMYIFIGIAGIGLLSWLIKDPGKLLLTVTITIVIGFILFLIINSVLHGNTFRGNSFGGNNSEMKKYRQAVKQSKQRYSKQHVNNQYKHTQRQTNKVRRRKRRRPTHLTVIHGKKSSLYKRDKNDQASN